MLFAPAPGFTGVAVANLRNPPSLHAVLLLSLFVFLIRAACRGADKEMITKKLFGANNNEAWL
ncbi:hypothetical protein BN439_2125 [Erwinia amylovora Ea644]|nr:hypothetical protein BN439_2125 [Erwinia amylovora Ea644]CCP07183.1 hypothetical protein BN440_2160 [Erwinia amylovora MR1]